MNKKWIVVLIIGFGVVMGACSNQQQAPGSPASSPAASTQSTSHESFYRTSVFLGDSITEGLSYHDVLPDDSVLAGAGKTAEFALEDVWELVSRKPEQVFIHVGSTDILWPTDDPIAYSMEHYGELINRIRKELPSTAITLLSITPVTAAAETAEPRYRTIGEYNDRLEELATLEQVRFIDLTPLVQEHAELYDTDGIHFQASFYPNMLNYLKDK